MDEEFRVARLDERDGARLVTEFTAEIAPRYPGWTPEAGPSATGDELAPPGGLFVVVYRGDEPTACGGFKGLDATRAEIKRVYVRPEHRGRGLARQLMQHLERAARDAGYRVVRLDTGAQQPDALALFQSTGYREIPDYNGNEFASYWLEKDLLPDAS